MIIPLSVIVIIPVLLGIFYVTPFEEPEVSQIQKNDSPDMSIFYFMMIGIWLIFLMRILIHLKRGTFRTMPRY